MTSDELADFAQRLRGLLDDGLATTGPARRRGLLLDAAGISRRHQRLVGALGALIEGRWLERLGAPPDSRDRWGPAVQAAAELHDVHGFDLLVSRDAARALLMAMGVEAAPGGVTPQEPVGAASAATLLVVDPMGRGDFTTLGAAIAASRPGGRIVVRPGLYRETLKVDKPLEIVGEAESGKTVITSPKGASCIHLKGVAVRLENLVVTGRNASLDAEGRIGRDGIDAVVVEGGMVFLHRCECAGEVGIRAGHGAFLSISQSLVGDCRSAGIWLQDGALGVIEDNEIGAGGIYLSGRGTAPNLRGNRLRGAIAIGLGAAPVVEDNEISGSGDYGIDIWARDRFNQPEKTCPTIRRNRISGCKLSGIFVHRGAGATIEDNDIRGNGDAGVEVSDSGSCPVIRGNRIAGNGSAAVWLRDGAAGTLEINDMSGNGGGELIAEPGTVVY